MAKKNVNKIWWSGFLVVTLVNQIRKTNHNEQDSKPHN
jgi:hypothetical protein